MLRVQLQIAIQSRVLFSLLAEVQEGDCDHTSQRCLSDVSGYIQSKVVYQSPTNTRYVSHSAHAIPDECPATLPTRCPEGICLERGRSCAAQWYQDLRKTPSNRVDSGKSIVALTYCDAGFASLWPTFIKCYTQALGCSHAEPETCGSFKPKLLDLGLSDQPGQTGPHCGHTGMPGWVQSKVASPALVQLTPTGVPMLLVAGVLEQLSHGSDVLRLDADAFLLDDPMEIFLKFPDADIISSPDFVGSFAENAWYRDLAYKRRHPTEDPFARWGFMMNTGLTYIRSNPKTVRLVQAALQALKTNATTFEQVALNEELAYLGCKWSEPERLPSGGNSSQNWNVLVTTPLLGKCADDFNVVVLPYYTMTRSLQQAPRAISMHVANDKVVESQQVATICDRRAQTRPK